MCGLSQVLVSVSDVTALLEKPINVSSLTQWKFLTYFTECVFANVLVALGTGKSPENRDENVKDLLDTLGTES